MFLSIGMECLALSGWFFWLVSLMSVKHRPWLCQSHANLLRFCDEKQILCSTQPMEGGGVYNAISLDEKTQSGLVFCEHYMPIWWKLIIARQESIISKWQTEFSWFWAEQSFQIWRVIVQNPNTALSIIKIYTQTKIVFELAKITDNLTVRVDLVISSFLIVNSFEQQDFPCNKYPTAFN